MTPLFVNSASIAVRERFVLAGGSWRKITLKVRFGFLDHPVMGPVLIDTGYSARIKQGGDRSLALKIYTALTSPELETEAVPFLASRGIAPDDLRTIIVTHFHADHVSALRDFPRARIHADTRALEKIRAASHSANVFDGVFKELLPDDVAERVVPFESAPAHDLPESLGQGFDIFGDQSAVCVPLPGHAAGHHGVWFGQADTPLLYATDVQWTRRAVTENAIPPLLTHMVSDNKAQMRESVARLRSYSEAGGAFLLCHDPQITQYDHKAAV